LVEKKPRRLGVDPCVTGDLLDRDELVGLMGDPFAARAVHDGRQMTVAGEDGAVGRPRDPADDGRDAGDALVRLEQAGDDGVVDRRVDRPPVDASVRTRSTMSSWLMPGMVRTSTQTEARAGLVFIWAATPASTTVGVM
jgi:hypothetical protein